MKIVLALLTCLVLALSHAGPAMSDPRTVASAQTCQHCNCGGTGCCVDPTPAAPQPAPGLPAAPTTQVDELANPPARPTQLVAHAPSRDPHDGHALPAPLPSGVPLHARNCCFLI